MITLNDVSKVIHDHVIFEHVTMNLKEGQIAGFIGSNGSGKTMCMRILSGLADPTEGKLLVDGKQKNRHKELLYDMGVIIETPRFFDAMTGYQNLCQLAEIKKRIDLKTIRETMNKVGLEYQDNKRVGQYSLGMKQRLGIAQAIMEDPEVLILDEPTNGLDNEGIIMVHTLLKEEKEKGKIIIISSHHKEDINDLCDCIYLFEGGHVQCIKES